MVGRAPCSPPSSRPISLLTAEQQVLGELAIARDTAATSQTVADMLTALGVSRSFSRPRVSNDNPYSESHFKHLKYSPNFPDRFASFAEAIAFCREFFAWYNHEHRHHGPPSTPGARRAHHRSAARAPYDGIGSLGPGAHVTPWRGEPQLNVVVFLAEDREGGLEGRHPEG